MMFSQQKSVMQSSLEQAITKGATKIGFDVGGVLCPKHDGEGASTSPPNYEIVDAMKFLKSRGVEIFIVSYCGKGKAAETAEWFVTHHLHDFFPKENVYFVGDHKTTKLPLIKLIGLDYFIDDTEQIVEAVSSGCTDPKIRKKWKNAKGCHGDGEWVKLTQIFDNWKETCENVDIACPAFLYQALS